jgi:hypothetical protein
LQALKLKNVPGDGLCLLHAIWLAIYGETVDGEVLKQFWDAFVERDDVLNRFVERMEREGNILSALKPDNWSVKGYGRYILKNIDTLWGDDYFMPIIVEFFGVSVTILDMQNSRPSDGESSSGVEWIDKASVRQVYPTPEASWMEELEERERSLLAAVKVVRKGNHYMALFTQTSVDLSSSSL